MRLNLLKTFLAVASHRQMSRAAAQVHLAQSSVSDQIQLLEAELGAELFIRSKTGLTLTPAGEALKPYAAEVLALMDEAHAAVGAADGQTAQSLRIGALETIASARAARWLSSLAQAHPGIDLKLTIAGSGELLQKLERGDIDVAFCFDKGSLDDRFMKRIVSVETLALVTSPERRPALISQNLPALAHERYVATETGCIYRHLLEKCFAEAGIGPPRLAAEVSSLRTISHLAAAGTGLALLPRLAVLDALERGNLVEVPWPGPVQAVPLVAIWRRRRVQPVALKALLACACVPFPAITPDGGRPRRAVSSRS